MIGLDKQPRYHKHSTTVTHKQGETDAHPKTEIRATANHGRLLFRWLCVGTSEGMREDRESHGQVERMVGELHETLYPLEWIDHS